MWGSLVVPSRLDREIFNMHVLGSVSECGIKNNFVGQFCGM